MSDQTGHTLTTPQPSGPSVQGAALPSAPSNIPAYIALSEAERAELLKSRRPGVWGLLTTAALVLLVVCGPAQQWAVLQRQAVMGGEPQFATDLAYKMPALMLTGMRGPLVTSLWLAAEKGKQDRDWESLQTYYNAIGALQPHFAQGYLMNGWNSAYNMSVQFNSLAYKYRWIRKGIVLVEQGDRRNPDNLDLVGYLSDLYGDKLGRSYEKDYYAVRYRGETLGYRLPPLPADASAHRVTDPETGEANGPARPPRRDSLGRVVRDDDPDRTRAWPVGEVFPYGIHPLGMGWWMAEKARRIQAATGHRHHQFGAPVISSRSTLMMRDWAYREHEHARRRARQVFDGRPFEAQYFELLPEEQQTRLKKRRGMTSLIEETRWYYDFSARLLERLPLEYQDHIERFAGRFQDDNGLYTRHSQNAWFDRQVMIANRAAFEGLLITTGRVAGTLPEAAEHFARAEQHYLKAVGDKRLYDMNNKEQWSSRLDIGMEAYLEIFIPANDMQRDQNRQDVLNDIAYFRNLAKIMANCRKECLLRQSDPIEDVFSRKTNINLIRWVIDREPPEPLGS